MIRIHVILWLCSFFVWHLLFVSSFCALVFPYGPLSLFIHWILWKLIWSLTICSLFSASLTTPAEIPRNFVPPHDFVEKNSRRLLDAVAAWARNQNLPVRFRRMATESGMTKAPNFCYICRLIKPDRAHHCRKCERCVLRMDHHCPVLGECIHMHNHKFFMLFLLWASMLCLFAVLTVSPTVIFRMLALYRHSNLARMIPTILVTSGTVNALVCGIALLCFLRELTIALLRNETTLEGIALHNYGERDAFDDGIAHFDLGSNFEERSDFSSINLCGEFRRPRQMSVENYHRTK
ncbi:putative palmitoyltransferase ZDHHC20 [Toxocara canis]|uniref:Palmitoyltransferase n=1 Tax=Toxocara canis TaxID=6265 RepID=A0A0B2UVX4_TOXCA|nr:putative palmitoyltransferase ZDHHC20 [Toxocara canis]